MQKTIKERLSYLENQLAYYRSVNNQLAVDQTSAVINELFYWESVYESDSFKKWEKAQNMIDNISFKENDRGVPAWMYLNVPKRKGN